MTHRPRLPVIRSGRLSLGLEPKRPARIERNIPRHCQQKLARKTLSAALLAVIAVVLAGSFQVHLPLLQAQVPSQKAAQLRHRQAKPMLTGIDGSQTGIASFKGNFTTISPPAGALSVFRKPNCSLSLATGTYAIEPSFMYTETELVSNYELFLHKEAQLTTTPDVFASGCAIQPTAGFGSQPGIFVGTTTTGVNVFAGIGLVYPAIVEGVYLLTGKTTFSLSSFQYSSVGNLTAADLNKDGNGDLLISDSPLAGSARVTVMLGKSDGTFQNGVIYPIAGNYSVAAVIDDVNGDGNLDIVAVSGDQQISVLMGNGDGTFKAAQSFAAPALPGYPGASSTPITNLITADLRGNGKKDVICSNGLVLLSNGDGTFTPVSTAAFPYYDDPISSYGVNLASGDINKDGKIDLVVNNSSTISTWIGNGDGTFTQGQSYATIGTDGFISVDDLDGDGNADVFVGLGDGGAFGGDEGSPSLSYALMGNGDGTFQGAPQIGFGAYTGSNLGDVTGSGTLDLITNTVDTPYGYPDTMVPAFTVQLGNGKGLFKPFSTITASASFVLNGTTVTGANTTAASTYAVGDINGDGKADLVFAEGGIYRGNSQDGVPVYFTAISNGDGTFPTPTPHAFPQIAPAGDYDYAVSVSGLQITNFTKGGKAGLIFTFNEQASGPTVTQPYNQGFAVLPGNGDGTFGALLLTTTSSTTTSPDFLPVLAAIADLNGDGNPDLVVINNTYVFGVGPASQVEVFLGNGDGTFKAPILVNTPANPTNLVLSDFNKDGKLDLAVVCGAINAQTDELAILLGNGDGTFGAPIIMTVASDIDGVANLAAADFNADGNVDLAMFSLFGYAGIFYGNGDGTFTSVNTGSYVVPKDLLNIESPSGAAIAVDLNGDGKPDILVGNTVLLNLYGSAPNTNLPVNSTTALTASTQTITAGTSVTFPATVTGPSGDTTVPTGTVTFMNGATTLGTASLSLSGVATYSTTLLPTGSNIITAVYGGDTNFNSSTSAAVTVTVTAAVNPSFALSSSNGGSIALSQGATTGNTSTVTVTPSNGLSGSVSLTCAVAGPAGGTSPATCSFASPSVTINGATAQTDTLTVTTTATTTAGAYMVTVTGMSDGITRITTVNVTVTTYVPPTFALTNGGAITINSPGATTGNTATITVTPSGGFTGSVALTAVIATSPIGATDLPTFSFGASTPVGITGASAGTGTLTVITTAATTAGFTRPSTRGVPWYAFGGATLACVLLFGIRARQRRRLSMLGMLILLAFLTGSILSCGGGGGGGGGGGTGNPGTTSGSYTITVTGTAGSTTEKTVVFLAVN